MNRETKEALEQLIEHWEENARAEDPTDVKLEPKEYALCQLFLWNNKSPCEGCPVSIRTGDPFCWGTPYDEAHRLWQHWRLNPHIEAQINLQTAAKKEVEFLKSLRGQPNEL